jgi:hypothetical protein
MLGLLGMRPAMPGISGMGGSVRRGWDGIEPLAGCCPPDAALTAAMGQTRRPAHTEPLSGARSRRVCRPGTRTIAELSKARRPALRRPP